MVDRVQAIKWETPAHGGTQEDLVPTEIDVHEDYLDCRGVAIQGATSNDSNVLVSRDGAGNMTFQDVVTSAKTLADLAAGGAFDPEIHRVLPQLAHEYDASGYEEYTYVSGRVTACVLWTSAAKVRKVREWAYTYTSGRVTTEVAIQYDATGVLVERLTYAYVYASGNVDHVTITRATV
jgi:hypothetical protein